MLLCTTLWYSLTTNNKMNRFKILPIIQIYFYSIFIQLYRQRHDRNLKNDDEHDLIHQIHEKRRRTTRLLSMSLSRATSMVDDSPEDATSQGDQPIRRNTLDVIKVIFVLTYK